MPVKINNSSKYTLFYKYIDSEINKMPEIVKLWQQKDQLVTDYWKIKRQLDNRRRGLRSDILNDKSKRAELKKQFDLERALQKLKEAC